MSDFNRRRFIVSSIAGSTALLAAPYGFSQISQRPKRAHIVVALADNQYQGIVPTTESLGNGQNPKTNLYWGAMYGVKSYFKRHKDWQSLDTSQSTNSYVLDQARFERTDASVVMDAEAWDGQYITKALRRFYQLLSNTDEEADLVGFVGHNTLMDKFTPGPIALPAVKSANLARERKAIMLACKSGPYFTETLKGIGVSPALMTKGLMAPEAYSLEAALSAWAKDGSMKTSAAQSYAKYQKIPQKNANWLFGVR